MLLYYYFRTLIHFSNYYLLVNPTKVNNKWNHKKKIVIDTGLDSFKRHISLMLLVTLQILSNGAYTSIEHRATVNKEKERISIAMFFNPKFEAEIGPVKSLISPENPPLFKNVLMEDYFKDFFSRNLNGKSHLEKMRIKSLDG